MIILMDKYTIINLKQKGHSERAIARELGINRKTVSKYWQEHLREQEKLKEDGGQLNLVQENIVSAPSYDSSCRKKRKYTCDLDRALDNILKTEDAKAKLLGNNKQQLTNVQIHGLLVGMGFDIGITTITNQVKLKRQRQKECFIKQDYDYADRLEFDFGEVKLLIAGQLQTFYLAVLSSPASNFRWAYLYKNQKKEVFLDAHVRFFEMLGGVYKEVVYDNMKNVVTRFIGKDKELNADLIKMAIYYGFEINTTNCYKGNEKGHVEGSVKIIRKEAFAPKLDFKSYEEACSYLDSVLVKMNESSSIEEEKKHLLAYKPPLESADILPVKVNSYSFVHIQGNKYSVPDYLVGHRLIAKIYHDRILLYANKRFVCRHEKVDGSNVISTDIRHYLNTFEKKPKALKNSLALKSIPRLKSIYELYFKTNPREFVALMRKYQDKNIDDMIQAIEKEVLIAAKPTLPRQSAINLYTSKQLAMYQQLSLGGEMKWMQ